MAKLSNISLLYNYKDAKKELEELEQDVFQEEKKVINPNIVLTQKEFTKREITIEKSREKVINKIALIHELQERDEKISKQFMIFLK